MASVARNVPLCVCNKLDLPPLQMSARLQFSSERSDELGQLRWVFVRRRQCRQGVSFLRHIAPLRLLFRNM